MTSSAFKSVFLCVKSMKAPELKDRLEESEKLIKEMMVSWEEKLRKTEEIAQVLNTQDAGCASVSYVSILSCEFNKAPFLPIEPKRTKSSLPDKQALKLGSRSKYFH